MWKGECILNGESSNSRSVAVLLNTNFEYNIMSVSKDVDGNMIVLDLNIGDISIKLLNIYAQNKDSPEFFNHIIDIIESNIQTYILLCGD